MKGRHPWNNKKDNQKLKHSSEELKKQKMKSCGKSNRNIILSNFTSLLIQFMFKLLVILFIIKMYPTKNTLRILLTAILSTNKMN